MKKSLFTALFVSLAFLTASVPVVSNAQAYYGSYSTYGASTGCLTLTAYQQLGTTDAETAGQVSLLQEFLNQTGYLSGVSGTFDTGTLGAVINYQNAHGIQPTGTLGPITISAINAQSCGYGNGYVGGYTPSYPITQYGNGSNCYWSGTYNSTYVCRTSGTPIVYPIVPVAPIVCNQNIYSNGYYGNTYGNYGYNNGCGYNYLQLKSLSASYNYNSTTITLTGYGFSSSGNTVHFGNTIISNVYSPNGTTLIFTVPTGYTYGTYSITVTNAQGGVSNALSFVMNSGNYYNNGGYGNWNNGGYNNCTSGYAYSNTYNNNCYSAPLLSSITGPATIPAGESATWAVSVTNSDTSYATLNADWGDGSTSVSNNSLNDAYSYNSNTYTFTHYYRTPGVYTLRITATSNNAQTTYATYTITVTGSGYYNY